MEADKIKDVSDLHASVGRGQLVDVLLSQCEPVVVEEYDPNDAGHALQFIDRHVAAARYVPGFGCWMVWDEHQWRTDSDGGITRMVVDHSRRLIVEAAAIQGYRERAAAVKEALRVGTKKVMEAMLTFAKCDKRVVISHQALDGNPFLLGVPNGVVELRTGTFRDGRREDLVSKRAGAPYIADADCPRWRQFLSEVLNGDVELIRYVQKLVGYTLTGDVSEQCFPFLFGGGKNGKSVFTETLHALLGEYAQRAPQSLLTVSINGREPSNEIARLHGARLVIGSETEEGARLAESRVKDVTGGDTLTGRFLYEEAFDFRPRLKLWLFGNHKPEIRGTDDGIWRRVRLIPFLVQIPEERRDPHLKAKLIEELPGILLWALEGTRLWLTEGLVPPQAVTEASTEYRDEEDTLGDFISDEIEPDDSEKTGTGAMFARYQQWAEGNGVRFPLSQRTLSKRLRERGLTLKKTHGERFWVGVALK